MDARVNYESQSSERGSGDKDCGLTPESGARVESLRTRLNGWHIDCFWFAGGRHIFLARCHSFSFSSCWNWFRRAVGLLLSNGGIAPPVKQAEDCRNEDQGAHPREHQTPNDRAPE